MKKSKIILFHPRTQHEKNYRYYHVPYSVLSLATMLDPSIFDVIILDNNCNNIDDYSEILSTIGDNILCVGISAMIGKQISDGLLFANSVRAFNPTIPIIWGGPITTFIPEETISNENIDVLVIGQGEITFAELVFAILENRRLGIVKGIIYKEKNKIKITPKRLIVPIGNFPNYKAVFKLIPISNYIRSDEHINSRTISYHSSQGCVYNCGFCCEIPLWEKKWSGFFVHKIIEDIEYLISNHGINGLKFYDSEFFINKNRVIHLAKEFINNNYNLKWYASIHPNNFIKLDIKELNILKKSGLSRLLVGAESGVEEELKLINKKTIKKSIEEIAKICSALEIHACFTFITGYPDTTSDSIEKTVEFATKLINIDSRHECKIHFYAPYPKTPLYKYAIGKGFVPPKTLDEWSEYDYYDITTPWVEEKYETIIRKFNETYYPYITKN
jgi:anaerobic magnesium-protoporphyrin IX monomethyl ester cyclase